MFPLLLDQLWSFLDAHLDDATVTQIHPDIVGQRTVSREGEVTTVERSIRFRRDVLRSTWKITYHRPSLARWEIVSGDGPMAPGSFLENQYSDAVGGTMIASRGELTVVRFPRFLQRRIARVALGRIDAQDRAYLSARAPPPPAR
ncbi:MAG: hypothetical protein L3K23_00510 [Thermoplasmata archaeon]|nr:hypothetical protein [Thermoplasmata archaeon]